MEDKIFRSLSDHSNENLPGSKQTPSFAKKSSLIRFEDPIPVTGPNLEQYRAGLILKAFHGDKKNSQHGHNSTTPRGSKTHGRAEKDKSIDSSLDIKAILHALLPPRTSTVLRKSGNGKQYEEKWVQFVSTSGATREDAIQLGETFDVLLKEKQARYVGICPMKEELISECFDELLRQVAVDCPERGLLLVRIRDELRMTLAAYRTIYERSLVFGSQKIGETIISVRSLEHEVKKLEEDVDGLEIEKLERESIVKRTKEKIQRQDSVLRSERNVEKQNLKEQISSLQKFLAQE